MDEEKKIMEKRSSFRGWKERNKGKIHRKRNVIILLTIAAIFSGMMIYPYLDKIDNDKNSSNNSTIKEQKNITSKPNKQGNKTSSPTATKTAVKTKDSGTKKAIVGKMGVPVVSNGLEITVKSTILTDLRTSVWIMVRNLDDKEKQFKLGSGTVIIDNMGEQYENIKVARSAEITQTNLSAQAMREGAVFFDRFKEGRNPKRLILNVNKEKIEFMLGNST